MPGPRHFACLLALALTGPAAIAQPPAAEPDPRYRIEIIVFAHHEGLAGDEDFGHGNELPVGTPPPRRLDLPPLEVESLAGFGRPAPDAAAEPNAGVEPNAGGAPDSGADPTPPPSGDRLELIEPDGAAPAGLPSRGLPGGFRPLTSEELLLGSVRGTLANRRAYTVLAHTGWVQSGVPVERAVPLDLRWLGITNPTGTIEFYIGRYLHVALDLNYRAGSGTLWTPRPGAALEPLVYAEGFELKAERRAIRREELHYIDHPMFGVLIQILAAPEPAAAASGGGPAG